MAKSEPPAGRIGRLMKPVVAKTAGPLLVVVNEQKNAEGRLMVQCAWFDTRWRRQCKWFFAEELIVAE